MKNYKERIICNIKAFWCNQTDNEQVLLGSSIAVILFTLFVFLHGIKDTPLNILILNAANSFFFCVKVLSIVFIYRLFRKRIIKSKLFYSIWIFFLLLSIPHIPVICGYKTTQIGDFYEAKEYKETYYVLMSRQPQEVKNRKVYTLPAEVERRLDYSHTTEVHEDYYLQEHGGTDAHILNYHINRLYFPNGGYLVFDYDEAYEDSERTDIELNKETEVIDYHGDYYYITLTDKKASK